MGRSRAEFGGAIAVEVSVSIASDIRLIVSRVFNPWRGHGLNTRATRRGRLLLVFRPPALADQLDEAARRDVGRLELVAAAVNRDEHLMIFRADREHRDA